MNASNDPLAVTLFSEIFTADQIARSHVTRALPKGMELSHFSVLNLLSSPQGEKSPAQLARMFHVTKGAMTNTLNTLAWAGYVHVRPDWEDARRKMITISPAGKAALASALQSVLPMISEIVAQVGPERVRGTLPVLREIREKLDELNKDG